MDKKLMIYSFAGLVADGAIAASGLINSKVENQGSQMPPIQQGDASMGGMQHGMGRNQITPSEDIQQRLRPNSLLQETSPPKRLSSYRSMFKIQRGKQSLILTLFKKI